MGNKGTVFYGRHHNPETILECLAMLAERNSLAAIHRTKGIKEETVMAWLREAANCKLTRVQLDAMWTYVGHKGEMGHFEEPDRGGFWHGTTIDIDARLRVGRAIENAATTSQLPSTQSWQNEDQVAMSLMSQIRDRSHRSSACNSD